MRPTERAKTVLQNFSDMYPAECDWDSSSMSIPHAEPQSTRSRLQLLDHHGSRSSSSLKKTKVFPIEPKTEPPLVKLWFNCLLPALPDLLSPILGRNFSASLIRRGHSNFHARPCIQIESPVPPMEPSQDIIRQRINLLCTTKQHPEIPIRFMRGSLSDLKGNEEHDLAEDSDGESTEDQKAKFNCARPSSRPGMGASLGVLCSDKVSATLDGYILIDHEKFMLTSDHFIKTSQDLADRGLADKDLETLMTPSICALKTMNLCLDQNKRDLDAERADYDPANDPNDQSRPTAKQRDILVRENIIKSLIGEVTKPIPEYIIGDVVKRKTDPRTASIPESLAEVLNRDAPELLNCQKPELNYHMDWALCSLRNQSGENRHKYRSRHDAVRDNCLEESNLGIRHGELCHTICDAESGKAVYYVGQGRLHRKGMVNLPMLVSTESCITHAWAILDSEGKSIPHSEVEGDSGAWVIRKNGHAVMGQLYAAANNGQLLFTPIKTIFDELAELCECEILLPPQPPMTGPAPIETSLLCAVTTEHRPRAYEFLMPGYVSAICSTSSSPTCNSPSSLPSLTDCSDSPPTTMESPKSAVSKEDEDAQGQADIILGRLENDTEVPSEVEGSGIPYLSLDQQIDKTPLGVKSHEYRPQSGLFHFRAKASAATWPELKSNVRLDLANRSSRFPQRQRLGSGVRRVWSVEGLGPRLLSQSII